MLSGTPNTDKAAETPKEHHSLGSKIIDALKPHHHKHDKDKDKKKTKADEPTSPVSSAQETHAPADVSAVPAPPKKHHHHKDKTSDGSEPKKHHHHRTKDKAADDATTKHKHHHRDKDKTAISPQSAIDLPDTTPVALKPQSPAPELEPLPVAPKPAPKPKESAEGKVLKAMTASEDAPKPETAKVKDCCKPSQVPSKQDAKVTTWGEWAQATLPGARLMSPLFALHRQAGQDWVNDVGKVFSGVKKKAADVENKAKDVVNDYKAKLRPRSK